MSEITKESLDRARAAITAEEDQKRLLNDRSGPPAPRPTREYIEASLGTPRSDEEINKAILNRAGAYQRNAEPASDYVEFPEPMKRDAEKERDQGMVERIRARADALINRSRSVDRDR